jgi:very-short-patch-repair endonuclease
MTDIGVLSTHELEARGMSRRGIATAVRTGRLRPIIRGWFATPTASADVIRAFELGGRAGCVTALGALGAWNPPDAGLHVAMATSASGRRMGAAPPEDVTVHWHGDAAHTGSRFAVSPPEAAIPHLVGCQPPHYSVAVLDSLLHRRLVSRNRLTAILAGTTGSAVRDLVTGLDERSESGIESIARFRLALAGIHAEPQVTVPGIGRVDLLIDGWLVVELDGREYHAQEAAFAADRRRTNLLYRNGRVVLQFDYAAVVYEWPHVQATIRSALSQHAPIRHPRRSSSPSAASLQQDFVR